MGYTHRRMLNHNYSYKNTAILIQIQDIYKCKENTKEDKRARLDNVRKLMDYENIKMNPNV